MLAEREKARFEEEKTRFAAANEERERERAIEREREIGRARERAREREDTAKLVAANEEDTVHLAAAAENTITRLDGERAHGMSVAADTTAQLEASLQETKSKHAVAQAYDRYTVRTAQRLEVEEAQGADEQHHVSEEKLDRVKKTPATGCTVVEMVDEATLVLLPAQWHASVQKEWLDGAHGVCAVDGAGVRNTLSASHRGQGKPNDKEREVEQTSSTRGVGQWDTTPLSVTEMGVESIAIRPMESRELCIIDDEVLAAHLQQYDLAAEMMRRVCVYIHMYVFVHTRICVYIYVHVCI